MGRRHRLVSDPKLCTGCETCVDVCVLRNSGFVDSSLSRLWISKKEADGIFLPFICRQCESAPCEKSCPVGAITRHSETQAYVINRELCTGCETCVSACPFGVVRIDDEGKAIKCEYCDGDPACAKACQPGALSWSDPIGPRTSSTQILPTGTEGEKKDQGPSDTRDAV